MKTEGQVRHKLQQVTYRHLQRAIRTSLSRKPENCAHNQLVKLPHGKELRFCSLRSGGDSYLCCDEAQGGLEQAYRCVDFKPLYSSQGVKKSFEDFFQNSDMATIAAQYPDLVALMWVLDVAGADVVANLDGMEDVLGEEPPVGEPPAEE